MVQTTQVKFTDRTLVLLEKIKADLAKIFGEGKIRIESVPEPVKLGKSVDISYLHKNRTEEAWFSLFFTIVLPLKEGQTKAETMTAMFLQPGFMYSVTKIELVLHDYAPADLEKLSENKALVTLVKANQNKYRNF
jgi:hypothetical protein